MKVFSSYFCVQVSNAERRAFVILLWHMCTRCKGLIESQWLKADRVRQSCLTCEILVENRKVPVPLTSLCVFEHHYSFLISCGGEGGIGINPYGNYTLEIYCLYTLYIYCSSKWA